MEKVMTLGEAARAARINADLTIKQVAARMGRNTCTVWELEKTSRMSERTYARLLKVFPQLQSIPFNPIRSRKQT